MKQAEKNRSEIGEAFLAKLTERVAHALAVRDCGQTGMKMPEKGHELWGVWNSCAQAVIAELDKELSALSEYDRTINWMTTCTSCARVLDSSYRETVRRELGGLTLKEVSDWAHSTRHVNAAVDVLKILEDGEERLSRTLEEEK